MQPNTKHWQIIYTMKSGDRIVSVEEGSDKTSVLMRVKKGLDADHQFVAAVDEKDRMLMFKSSEVESFGLRLLKTEEVTKMLLASQGDNNADNQAD